MKPGYVKEIHDICSNKKVPFAEGYSSWTVVYIRFKDKIYWCGSDGYAWIKGQRGDYFSSNSRDRISREKLVDIVSLVDGKLVFTPYQEFNHNT
jgi:hypothetical protein